MSALPGPTVEARALHKRYGSGDRSGGGALADVSLDAGPGVTAVLGPNGAGKTTFLSLCLGFLRPTAGAVTVDGAPPARWLRSRGAGYVPERFAAPGAWRVGPALRDLGRVGPRPSHPAAREAAPVLARFGLDGLAGRRVGELSRGELQRFALAQAAIGNPPLLILDEPEQGLDADGRGALLAWVREQRGAGATVLLSTHDPALAAALADAVVVLARGSIGAAFRAADRERVPSAYRVTLEAPHPALAEWADAGGDEAVDDALDEAVVPVADAAGLQACLRALQDRGARVVGVAPARIALEDRIREVLATSGAEA
jgi:ABC-type multidrug transport system ATPase subunit